MGAVSPYGEGVETLVAGFASGRSTVERAEELGELSGLRSRLKSVVPEVDARVIARKHRRAMSKLGVFAALAAREAWGSSGLTQEAAGDGRTGVCIGSIMASPDALEALFNEYLVNHSLEKIKATRFFQIMGHSPAASVAQLLGITGRTIAPTAACATGCQAVGLATEFIRYGMQDRMVAGGADEHHVMTTATFDIINAAAVAHNDRPEIASRPFDTARDGVVCGEGAGILVVEELEAARARGATILAEVAGFATLGDPSNLANPDSDAIARCISEALEQAKVGPGEVDYVNAHATGTLQGDAAEAQAIAKVFGADIMVSSLKGHIGHTMAAAGALELIATVEMMRRGVVYPTRNLDEVDPACAGVDHVREVRTRQVKIAVKNSFAMGGVNSSMVLRRYE
jgi:3-oxoacyl-[acyl-carrier-protein] synthase II